MEEGIKNRIIIILAILTAIFFISTVGSCNNAQQQRLNRDKEMATRLDLEEKMGKFTQEKETIEAKLNSATEELEKEKAAHQVTQKALSQEQLMTQSLKEELEKITKLKETLEEDLKEALITGSSKKSK